MGNHRVNPFARGTTVVRPTKLRDALGRELQEGDLVILPKSLAPTARVMQIRPNLHPGAPPNTLSVVLQVVLPFIAPADTPLGDIVLIQTAPEPSPNGAPEEHPSAAPGGPLGLVVTDADDAPREDDETGSGEG